MEINSRKVFVVHGRNGKLRAEVFQFLRSLGLDPTEWSQAVADTGHASPYIGDVLTTAFDEAQAILVLLTPDDVAYLHDSLADENDPETSPQLQPRPNVLFEAGMAMGRDDSRTVLVEMGRVKTFSDIQGRHVVRLDNTTAKRQDLATRLKNAGCAVNMTGTDWHTAGDLTPPAPAGGGLPMGRKLPSSQASNKPKLSARLSMPGGNKLGKILVTNLGPGDVFDLDVHPAEGEESGLFREEDDFPLPKLPQGKSVASLRVLPLSMATRSKSHFNIVITGTTVDGTPFEQHEFVSQD
ncbi:TIR domain-containing protein [Arthrobacter sp. 31Y]|uniref:TIR domain-containing protein n=1 Tax=Arthrobacter sp. 31Y TaxID=1115632 RepID=UPI0005BE56C4|nr:nucleotide-binding protein [Arthrobacter sp. 31Y]